MASNGLPPVKAVGDALVLLETGITPFRDQLDPSFLEQFDVFALRVGGERRTSTRANALSLTAVHNDIYG